MCVPSHVHAFTATAYLHHARLQAHILFLGPLWQLGRGNGPMSSGHLVVLEGRLPHGVLLPYCAAMLHHGGAGTTYTTLQAGKPSMVSHRAQCTK